MGEMMNGHGLQGKATEMINYSFSQLSQKILVVIKIWCWTFLPLYLFSGSRVRQLKGFFFEMGQQELSRFWYYNTIVVCKRLTSDQVITSNDMSFYFCFYWTCIYMSFCL